MNHSSGINPYFTGDGFIGRFLRGRSHNAGAEVLIPRTATETAWTLK